MSASHPLDGDGVSHLLFHYLAKDATMLARRRGRSDGKGGGTSPRRAASPSSSPRGRSKRPRRRRARTDDDGSPEYRIPDTVVFFNTPTTWYYWDEAAHKCERKDAKELEKENLERFFGQPAGKNCDICCSFLSRKSGEPDSVVFLDKDELHDFLYSRPEHHGLLQRFVVPQGDNNYMFQAVWCRRGSENGVTTGVTKVFKRISRQKLKDRFATKMKRANPAEEGHQTFVPLAKYRLQQQRKAAAAATGGNASSVAAASQPPTSPPPSLPNVSAINAVNESGTLSPPLSPPSTTKRKPALDPAARRPVSPARSPDRNALSIPLSNETRPINAELCRAAKLCSSLRTDFCRKQQHYDKAITFEGSAHYAEERWCHAGISDKIAKACQRLVEHFEAIDHMYTIARMVLYFKEDAEGRLWLMFSSSMRIQEARHKSAVSATEEFKDVYRFLGALTPHFKGLYTPEEDEGSKKKKIRATPRNLGADLRPVQLGSRTVTSPTPSSPPRLLDRAVLKPAANESLVARIEKERTEGDGSNMSLAKEIAAYENANARLRAELRAIQRETRVLHGAQGGLLDADSYLSRLSGGTLSPIKPSVPSGRASAGPPEAAAAAAIAVVMQCAPSPSPSALSIHLDDLRKVSKSAAPRTAAALLGGMGRVLPPRKGKVALTAKPRVLSDEKTAAIVEMIVRSHDTQKERRKCRYDNRLYTLDEMLSKDWVDPTSWSVDWESSAPEAPYQVVLAHASTPADEFDDLMYTVFSEVALHSHSLLTAGQAPEVHVVHKDQLFGEVVYDIARYFPSDYLFDVPPHLAAVLLPTFEMQTKAIRMHPFDPVIEYERVIDEETDRVSRNARLPGVKPQEVAAMNQKVEEMRGKLDQLKTMNATAQPGEPVTFIIRGGERATVPEFNQLMTDFRHAVIREVEDERAGFLAELRRRVQNATWRDEIRCSPLALASDTPPLASPPGSPLTTAM